MRSPQVLVLIQKMSEIKKPSRETGLSGVARERFELSASGL